MNRISNTLAWLVIIITAAAFTLAFSLSCTSDLAVKPNVIPLLPKGKAIEYMISHGLDCIHYTTDYAFDTGISRSIEQICMEDLENVPRLSANQQLTVTIMTYEEYMAYVEDEEDPCHSCPGWLCNPLTQIVVMCWWDGGTYHCRVIDWGDCSSFKGFGEQ
jgi:hypothetical protein